MRRPDFTLSARLHQNLALSPTLEINERVNQMWADGQEVFHLGFGESRFPVHPRIIEALQANAYRQSYLPAQGLPALREEIAAFYSRQLGQAISAAQIMVGPGSKALIFALQMALDAELLLPTPSWVSYAPQAQLLGRPVRYIPGKAADNYELTLAALEETVAAAEEAASPSPKILLLNSPNNPTGRMFSPSLLADIASYCRRKGIVVLSDEIYALVAHEGRQHVSIAHYYPEGTVVLGGLSKHLSLGGWRLGTAVLPGNNAGMSLLQALLTLASEIWSTPAAPVQYAALVAYSDDPAVTAYIEECRRLHTIRTRHVWSWLVEIGIRCPQPDGGFYLFANLDRRREALARLGIRTSLDLARYLLESYQIATLPGSVFGVAPEELSLRLATSYLDMETDEKAAALLAAFRKDPDPDRLMARHHPQFNQALARFQSFMARLS